MSSPCLYAPILVQFQLLGEELEEAGAVAAVLLRCAHHTDGGDKELCARLGRAVYRHGQARTQGHVHALQGTRKFHQKRVQARLTLRAEKRGVEDARTPQGQGLGAWTGVLGGHVRVMAREGNTEQMGVGVGLRDHGERKVSLAGGGRRPLGGVGVKVVK